MYIAVTLSTQAKVKCLALYPVTKFGWSASEKNQTRQVCVCACVCVFVRVIAMSLLYMTMDSFNEYTQCQW